MEGPCRSAEWRAATTASVAVFSGSIATQLERFETGGMRQVIRRKSEEWPLQKRNKPVDRPAPLPSGPRGAGAGAGAGPVAAGLSAVGGSPGAT